MKSHKNQHRKSPLFLMVAKFSKMQKASYSLQSEMKYVLNRLALLEHSAAFMSTVLDLQAVQLAEEGPKTIFEKAQVLEPVLLVP